MKYVRVKYGIFKVVSDDGDKLQVGVRGFGCRYISKRVVIKGADSIDELCDCLVLWKKIYPIRHHTAKDEIDSHAIKYGEYAWNESKYKEVYENTYGAILTNRGLIYVAKLNDKAEWELL